MADLQVTREVIVFLNNFHNVDLFQRGFYQLRCRVEDPSKAVSHVECDIKEKLKNGRAAPCLFKPFVDQYSNTGISKTIEVYYKHEEVQIDDMFKFQVHILVDSCKLASQIPLKLQLVLDLYFAESSRSPATPRSLEHASTQVLTMHLSADEPYHAYRPVLFDYFHFAAVTLTIHSSLIAFRQPWSSALKSLHPIWSGKTGHVRQYTYSCLFGKSASSIQPNEQLEHRYKENASYLHRKLCLQLLKLYENLLAHYHSLLSLLPEYGQMKLSNVDVDAKLEVLNSELNGLVTAEDVFLRMGDDLYLLSTELNMLWTQFVEQFLHENLLLKQLIEDHHILRLEHMKEALFTQDHPWEALCSSLEISTSQQAKMFSNIKNSSYYQLVMPISLECAALDGDSSTMPIIFEDKFVPGKKGDGIEGRIMSVQEYLVDDFVDMNVNIQDSTKKMEKPRKPINDDSSGKSKISALKNRTGIPPKEKEYYEAIRNSANYAWGVSKNESEGFVETDLTGSDYCSPELDVKPQALNTDCVDIRLKDTDSVFSESDSNCSSKSTFYTKLDSGIETESAVDDTLLEDAEENKVLTEPSSDRSERTSSSSSQPNNQKLWSCFPTKGCTMNGTGSPYKSSTISISQPYAPVARQISLSKSTEEREKHMLRFQEARERLEINLEIPGHNYRLRNDSIHIKPYFTERRVSTMENVHLIVCVHGLDGNSGDLRLVRCFLEMALPRTNLDFLMSEINQEDTFCDIDDMTARLVEEILDYIEDQKLDVTRLSFVGHSLGNIIIRNAVVHSSLYLYRNKLYTFLSLSGPHLGMQFHTSNLVSTGMWLMQKWKKEGSLVQLALNDTSDPRDSFMYRLSLTNGFQYFKNVLLVSSVQDHYVPFHSARVEITKNVVKDNSEDGRIYKEMLDHILGPLMAQEEVNIVKYSVHHPMPTSANTFIGRAAHIAMLDSELFLEKFILCIAHKYFL